MSNYSEYYKPQFARDITVPDTKKFKTSIVMQKCTFRAIDDIIEAFPSYKSRTRVIEEAVSYFAKFLKETANQEATRNG